MTPGWVAIWRGKSATVFLDPEGGWSLDPNTARVFKTWAGARFAAGLTKGTAVVRAWT